MNFRKNSYTKPFKLFLLFILIIFNIGFSSCSDKKERFINTTLELLIIQHKFPNDTIARKNEEYKIYEKYGFSTKSYKELFETYQKDNKEFLTIMDTIKTRLKNEILLIESKRR